MSEQTVPINRQTGERFVRVVKDFLSSEVRWQALGLSALLIGFVLAINGLNVVNSYVGRDFMTAISHRDRGRVRPAGHPLRRRVRGLDGGGGPVALHRGAARAALAGVADPAGRPSLPRRTAPTTGSRSRARLDNPDQRIADDVRAFTATTLSFTLMFLNGTLAVLSFSGVLVDDQPAAVRRRRRLRRARHAGSRSASAGRWSA